MKKILLIILLLFICSCSVKEIEQSQDFCGISTSGSCTEDSECITDGCSGEVCKSVNEEPIVSSCIWLDCYENINYECKCSNNQCKWI